MTNDVTDLLTALRDGAISLDDVVRRFRERSWPRRETTPTTTYADIGMAELQDPEPYLPGSFDDVTAAYHRGDLSDEQYEALAQAMAASVKAEDAGSDSR